MHDDSKMGNLLQKNISYIFLKFVIRLILALSLHGSCLGITHRGNSLGSVFLSFFF